MPLPRPSASLRSGVRPRLLRGTTIGIVGAGLIGGSFIRALRRHRPAIRILATDRNLTLAPLVARYASWCVTLDALVTQSDVVVLAVPVPAIIGLLPRVAKLAASRQSRRRLLVCDTGTLKAPVMAAARRHVAHFDFVGLHPMAGGEDNGWGASRARLFRGRSVMLCATAAAPGRRARELATLIGGVPRPTDARTHDRAVAAFIGLPHLLAFAAAGLDGLPRVDALRGDSWKSLTRVSVSDARMVAGFYYGNATNQLAVLRRYRAVLGRIEALLRRGSLKGLERQLARWRGGAVPPGAGR